MSRRLGAKGYRSRLCTAFQLPGSGIQGLPAEAYRRRPEGEDGMGDVIDATPRLGKCGIGTRLRTARLQCRVSLEKLSERSGIAPERIAAYESGRRIGARHLDMLI